jgi:two-component system, cell cycle sensor histidine kinase and response regulator CckA
MTAADRTSKAPSSRLVTRLKRFFARPILSVAGRSKTEGVRDELSPAIDPSDLAIAQFAHDLRNLMTVMIGCAECMHQHVPEGKADREFRELLQAGERASMLTRELLLTARPRSIARSQIDLNQAVGSAFEMLARLAGDTIRVRLRVSAEPALIVADLADVERILLNLALNARDAMPDGGVLTIETSVIDNPSNDEYAVLGPHVRLVVSDTGRGMTPDVRARIFEPFFTTKETGTGVGMSSVSFTVRQLEGTLSVESQPNGGTSVIVDIPCAPTWSWSGPDAP